MMNINVKEIHNSAKFIEIIVILFYHNISVNLQNYYSIDGKDVYNMGHKISPLHLIDTYNRTFDMNNTN